MEKDYKKFYEQIAKRNKLTVSQAGSIRGYLLGAKGDKELAKSLIDKTTMKSRRRRKHSLEYYYELFAIVSKLSEKEIMDLTQEIK